MKKPFRGLPYICTALALALLLAGCGPADYTAAEDPQPNPQQSHPAVTPSAPPAAVTSAPTEPPTETATETPADPTTTAPTPAPPQLPADDANIPYTFGTYVEQSAPVDDSWFATAAFLGDSRTEGLKVFSGLQYGDFIYSRGMNVFRVDDPKYTVTAADGNNYTLLGTLALKQYDSVYIMMGINELGYPVSSYRSGLSTLLERVKQIQPNAVIYLQTLPPVNESAAQANGLDPSINNTNVAAFNQVITELAAQYQVALVDTGAAYRDASGSLPADLASDGVHFSASAYRRWADYLASHTMSFQRYSNSCG